MESKEKDGHSKHAFIKLIRVKEGEGILSLEEQKLCRCSVEILFLVKHTRPDLVNATHELSKAMDVAKYLHWKELLRVVTFTLHTQ